MSHIQPVQLDEVMTHIEPVQVDQVMAHIEPVQVDQVMAHIQPVQLNDMEVQYDMALLNATFRSVGVRIHIQCHLTEHGFSDTPDTRYYSVEYICS